MIAARSASCGGEAMARHGPGAKLLVLFCVSLLCFLLLVLADIETLNVETCSGGISCVPANLNSDDNANDGATIGKNSAITTTWSNTTFSSASTIDEVFFVITHGGVTGITSSLTIAFRNAALTTTYCSFAVTNVVASTKEIIDTTSSCAWTKSRLDDLAIVVTNPNAAKQNAYISFLDINISYTPPDTTPPNVALSAPGNDSWDLDGNVTFEYLPVDDRGFKNCTLFIDGAFNKTNVTSVLNNSINNFTVTGLADGNHTWFVNCSDTSNLTNVSVTRLVKIDTTAPVVNLMTPLNNNFSTEPEMVFWYNASDAQTALDECILYVSNLTKGTHAAPAEGVALNFTVSFANGDYTWWVNCTDTNGFVKKSEERNFTITVSTPTITPGSPSYTLGQTALFTGENWNPSIQVTINYTLPNGTILTHLVTTTGIGTLTDSLYLNYSFPNGTYAIYAYQTTLPADNSSTSFAVNLPSTTLSATPSPLAQGETIVFSGTSFSENSTITIILRYANGSNESFNTSSNATGGFIVQRNLTYTAAVGQTNVTAFDYPYPAINATSSFMIMQRNVSLVASPSPVARSQDVFFTGSNFTRLGTVTLRLYDNQTNASATSFPLNVTVYDNGSFTYTWNTGSTCNGIYRVEAFDLNNSYNITAYFTISQLTQNNDVKKIAAGYKFSNVGSAITNSNVNLSDETDETLSTNAGTTWYYELNFTNSYNRGLLVNNVIFFIEHAETAGLTSPALQYWNGSAWVGTSCSFAAGTSDHNETCDIVSYFNTPLKLDLAAVRFTLSKTGGGPQTSTVDYTHLNITTSYEPACVYFNGSTGGGLQDNPPAVSAVSLDDGLTSPSDELDLNAGTTRQAWCNFTVSDNDGYQNVSIVNATLYSSVVAPTAIDNNRTHYTNTSCTLVAGVGNVANYSCGFALWYYAVNGTWNCLVKATDGGSLTNASAAVSMNALYAVNLSSELLDYGSLTEGETSTERTANLSNIGNMNITLKVLGYGNTLGDGVAFVCPQETLSYDSHRYSNVSGSFATKWLLTGAFAPLNVSINATTNGTPWIKQSFWQVQIPTTGEPSGVCNGTIVFQAEAS